MSAAFQVRCYDVQWKKHSYQSPKKGEVPVDQSIREAASALIPLGRDFRLVYALVEALTEADQNQTGVITLAYLNALLLYLSQGRNVDLLPEKWQLPSKEVLLEWFLVDILQRQDLEALKKILKPRTKKDRQEGALIRHVTASCTCSRYETFGTGRNKMATTVSCDTCGRRVHRSCLMAPSPGMCTDRLLDGFLTGRHNTRVLAA